MRRFGIATFAVCAVLVAGTISPSAATWADAEVATGGFTAGTVMPPTNVTCTAGLLQPATFSWQLPSGGLERTALHWEVTGGLGLSGSGDLSPTATSLVLNSTLLGLGSGTFTLYATGPGDWTSTEVTGSVSLIQALFLNVNSTCSVP